MLFRYIVENALIMLGNASCQIISQLNKHYHITSQQHHHITISLLPVFWCTPPKNQIITFFTLFLTKIKPHLTHNHNLLIPCHYCYLTLQAIHCLTRNFLTFCSDFEGYTALSWQNTVNEIGMENAFSFRKG